MKTKAKKGGGGVESVKPVKAWAVVQRGGLLYAHRVKPTRAAADLAAEYGRMFNHCQWDVIPVLISPILSKKKKGSKGVRNAK